MLKKILLGVVLLLMLAAGGAFAFFKMQVHAFDVSMAKHYEIALPTVQLTDDPLLLARGKHLAEALGACTTCHGDNFGGGKAESMGPLGKLVYPNVTSSPDGALSKYSDAELIRLLRHGVKRDGTSVQMMPVQEWSWWPDADRIAVASYLRRSVQPVAGQPGDVQWSDFAKLLDRLNKIPIDVARRVDHDATPSTTSPAESAEYGKLLAVGCRGCHGEDHMAGGRIPGTPPEMPAPKNLTPHETGLKDWTYDDFVATVRTGKRKGTGDVLNPMMPVAALQKFDETELKAVWAYLRTLPPVEFGKR
jgi:mono/diheme cytochrome c family protein